MVSTLSERSVYLSERVDWQVDKRVMASSNLSVVVLRVVWSAMATAARQVGPVLGT